jgi:hypothetical protein
VLMLLFAFIYWVGPNFRQRQPYPWISPGAVLGVVLWLAASGLFGVYVSLFAGNYTGSRSVYGSLGGAIVFMLWLQVSMLALLAGAEVNQVLQLRAGQRSSTAEMAGFGGEPAPVVTTTGPLGMEVDEAPSPPLAPAPRRADSDRTAEAPDEQSSHGMAVGGLAASAFGVLSGLLGLIGLLRHRRRE